MELIVFAGPSLPPKARPRNGAITYRPPAAWGDVAKVAAQAPRAIGIIDGAFETTASSWHKEILWALSRGIAVFGAASLGALRAVELEPFGMTGVGQVFKAYRDGLIEDDDEVAVQHGPEETGYVNLTTTMVNIRATLERASTQHILAIAERDTLLQSAKGLYYKDRTWEAVLQASLRSGLSKGSFDRLAVWLPGNEADIKAHDAALMIDEMIRWRSSPSLEGTAPVFPDTLHWREMKRRLFDGSARYRVGRRPHLG